MDLQEPGPPGGAPPTPSTWSPMPRSTYGYKPPLPEPSPIEVWGKRVIFGFAVGLAIYLGWRAFGPAGVERVGAKPAAGRTVMVLLHGYGAAGDDLLGLAKEMAPAAPEVTFLVPAGPHRVDGTGRAWLPSISAPSMEEAVIKLDQEIAATSRRLWETIDGVRKKGVRCEDIYVGGFSQGGRMAAEVALRAPEGCALGGVVVMSGGGMDRAVLRSAKGLPRMRVLVTHGDGDRVVSIATGRATAQHFAAGGHDVRWLEFHGPHTIPTEVREAIPPFLKGQVVGEAVGATGP